jgi:CDP-diacylglycerol--glycerol-3-phosphate 3-phosphatidyltransferase
MNWPNKLSFFRLFLIPVILIILYSNIEYSIYIATIVFIIAALTDAIDGYIARTRNQITDFGKFIDPLVDKILVVSILVYLVGVQSIPDWIVIIIIGREFAISGYRIIAASKGVVVAASTIAKFKTQSQMIAVIFALLDIPYFIVVMYIAVILTVISGAEYLYNGRDLFKEKKK